MFESVPYAVLYYNDIANPIDITKQTVSVNLKRQGSGRIRAASLMLDAFNGQFISNLNGGVTPILKHFDTIKILFNDGTTTISAILEVDQILKQLTVAGKVLLPLELLGKERALRDVKTTAYFRFKDPRIALETLKSRYNAQRGINQPAWSFVDPVTLAGTNEAPDNINNIYDLSAGISYYDAVMQILSRLNQPTTLNGSGTFWSMTIDDDETFAVGAIVMRIFEQGKTTGSIPVIESTENDPFHKVTTQIHSLTGTQVLVRGTPNTGTMPPDLHRFSSYVEAINNLPPWNALSTYLKGIRVNVDNVIFEALIFVPAGFNPPTNGLFWKPVTARNIIDSFIATDYPAYNTSFTYPAGIRVSHQDIAYESIQSVPGGVSPPNPAFWNPITINYSLFTKNKDIVTKNSCSNPDKAFLATGFLAPAFPDGNLVIRDRLDPNTNDFKFYRDFAWVRAKNDADIFSDPRMKQYLMGTNKNVFYKGFTVLIDSSLGTPGGAFAGKDRFGRFFIDTIAQFDGEEWIVQRTPAVGDECAVYLEGKVYEYNVAIALPTSFYGNAFATPSFSPRFRGPDGTKKWRDISGTPGGNDCFHAPTKIELTQGLIASKINGQDYSSYVQNSALKITYSYNAASAIYKSGKTLFDKVYSTVSKFFEGLGKAQINTEFTLTADEIGLTLEEQWYSYGWWYALPFPYPFSAFNGITEKVGELYGGNQFTSSEFAALDIQNSNFSHSGLSGFNHSEVSDMGGPFTGIKFWFQFDILILNQRQLFQGNLPFTITVYDDTRNVWRTDFTLRMLGDPQEVIIPFSSFTVTRPSRTPFHIDSLSDIVDLVAVSELEILSIFDEKRVRLITIQLAQSYDEYLRFMSVSLDRFIRTQIETAQVDFVGIIDGLVLTKAPFVSSGEEDNRVINPDILEASNVRNYLQLKSIAVAEKDLAGLPFEQFTVVRNGKCDLKIEQSVYLKNVDLINETDQPGTPNTRKLILMSDELSYDEKNGFLKTSMLTKRLGGP